MTPRSSPHTATLPSVLGAILMLGMPAAYGAATLVSSTPTRYAALIHSPHVIRLRFSEAVVKKSSMVKLTDPSGRQMRVSLVKNHDASTLEVKIRTRLEAGVYVVHWTLVSAVDGSKTAGAFQFTVR
jgi:methionine-rich copper-binding protein CopC